jgi:hypothetical protein
LQISNIAQPAAYAALTYHVAKTTKLRHISRIVTQNVKVRLQILLQRAYHCPLDLTFFTKT